MHAPTAIRCSTHDEQRGPHRKHVRGTLGVAVRVSHAPPARPTTLSLRSGCAARHEEQRSASSAGAALC
jgi:hypothetical protein